MPATLLVEDDPVSQMVIQDLFRFDNLPGELVCVSSAEEALQIWPSIQPDVVLMDVMLPGISGIEATRIIRMNEQEEHHKPAYIIAVTASAMPRDCEACLAAGMDAYVSKPIRRKNLRELLAKVAETESRVSTQGVPQ
jgi:CheY-like chemotaxis protein